MSKETTEVFKEESSGVPSSSQVSRRRFLNFAGASAAGLFVASSCSKKFPDYFPGHHGDGKPEVEVQLGSGDIGILNYAYALEQLEAAFYIKVSAKGCFDGASDIEKEYLSDIRDHEIAHREFLKNVLGKSAIGTLMLDFSSIDFSSRSSVLGTAKAFEDLGVSAYNGAGELIVNPTYLLLAGKIVSVEARHAAAVRDLIKYGDFAGSDVVDSMGLDVYRAPKEVLGIAGTYIKTKILYNKLPTS